MNWIIFIFLAIGTVDGHSEPSKPKVLKGKEAKNFHQQMAAGLNLESKIKEEDSFTKKNEEKAELERQIQELDLQIKATKGISPKKAKEFGKKRSALKEQIALVEKELELHKKNREQMD